MNKIVTYGGIALMAFGFFAMFYGIYQLSIMPVNEHIATYNTTDISWAFTPTNPQGLSILGIFPTIFGTILAIQGIYMNDSKKKNITLTSSNERVEEKQK